MPTPRVQTARRFQHPTDPLHPERRLQEGLTARADPDDPDKLEQVLAGAVRRLGVPGLDIDSYELEVRVHGQESLVTTFVEDHPGIRGGHMPL